MHSLRFLLLIFCPCSLLLANGSRLPSQDATAVARGYAWIATADNPSAVYYNPSGLAYLDGSIQVGSHFLRSSGSYSNGTTTADLDDRTFVLPSLFASQPLMIGKHAYTLGLGVFAPFGTETNWPTNGPFAAVATRNKITFLRYALALATKVTDHFSVGATAQWNEIETDLHRAAGVVPGDDFGFSGNGTAGSFSLGAMYRPTEHHSFGIQYQAQTKFSIAGTTLIMPFNLAEPGKVDWPFPADLSFGYSYRPDAHWNFEISYDVTFWSVLNTLTLARPVSGPLQIPFNWNDSAYYGIGGTYTNGAFRYSAGINFSENSVPSRWFSPSVPDVSRWLFNAGIGYTSGHWSFDGLLQVAPNTKRTIQDNVLGGLVNGVYRGSLLGMTVQLNYQW